MRFIKPPLLPTLLTILGVCILCGLGNWQLQRLEWKQELIKTYSANSTELNGRFIESTQIKIAPRTHKGKVGSHIYALFDSRALGTLWVHRGWVPVDHAEKFPQKTRIKGRMKNPETPNAFTPQNEPQNSAWYWTDIAAMSTHVGKGNTHHQILLEEHEQTGNPPFSYEPALKNDHLQYAFFWFAMAAAMIGVYVLRFAVAKD